MKTILLVEDSRFLRIANERILIKAGYQVLGAHDGEEALLVARESLPDLVILDMLLPKLGGPQVLQALKKDPSTTQIPVIVLSGMSQRNEQKLKREGAWAFMEKASLLNNPRSLLEAIRQALAHDTAEVIRE